MQANSLSNRVGAAATRSNHASFYTTVARLLTVGALVALGGCAPTMVGQVAQAGYDVARKTLGNDATAQAPDERQQKLRAIMNQVEIGQEIGPIVESMGEPPKEKSGNSQGYTCYEYASVYSATDAAVIVARDGKVVYYGNSRCTAEMQGVNFTSGGKYAP
ncbi:hypothetical protein GSY71_01055 [Pusillimonas sp. TS35]|nr:hypothetical protein [Pusillimonas sp. TS35]